MSSSEPSYIPLLYASSIAFEFSLSPYPSASLSSSSKLGGGFKWTVSIANYQQGDYEGACGCGRSASAAAACPHVLRVVMACRKADLLSFRKPWQVTRHTLNRLPKLRTHQLSNLLERYTLASVDAHDNAVVSPCFCKKSTSH